MNRNNISRRQFLQMMGAATVGTVVSACQPQTPTPTPTSTLTPTSKPTLTPSITPSPEPTKTLEPGVIPTATSTASVPWNPQAQVAIGQQADYERKAVRQRVQKMLDDLGGLGDIVPKGGKVALKVNLTGGVGAYQMDGIPATESVVTHPEIVRALGELLIDAGAGQLYIVESVWGWDSFVQWGYEEIAKPLNATLIDLNEPKPYNDFVKAPVGDGHLIYEDFTLNPILTEVDTFISVAKMKCHIECGITLSMKNLVGLTPYSVYAVQASDGRRSALHEDSKTRLPRIVLDLNMARPIHLAVIDGIKTIEGGEGTWAKDVRQVSPGLLLAGKKAVATDAAATMVMGFDALARYPAPPFTRADNYLNLAFNLGMGTNLPEEIEVLGPAIADVRFPFAPATGYKE